MPSDSELWTRARGEDRQAFADLFERHAQAIYNYCFRRVGNWASAEDLTSVVFLEAWRRRSVELPEGMVLPWLYGVATNVVRNANRSRRHPKGFGGLFGAEANDHTKPENFLLGLRQAVQEIVHDLCG